MSKPFYIDNARIEHGCCWGAAIVQDCKKGQGMYGGDTDLICECDADKAQFICDALNTAQDVANAMAR
jgi:hypothetical protein